MAAPLNPSVFVPIGFGALILWRTYSRIRRMVGRQQLTKVRPWVTVTVFPMIIVALAVAGSKQPDGNSLLLLIGGLAIGTGLGTYGLRVTRFEKTPQGLFYTPSAHLGIALSLLFVGRVIYRLFQMNVFSGGPPPTDQQFATTPLTLSIFGTLAGYYVTYAIGLLRWRYGPEAPGA